MGSPSSLGARVLAEQLAADARVLAERSDLSDRLAWMNEALELLVTFDIRDRANELTAEERRIMAVFYDRSDCPEDFCQWVAQQSGNFVAQARAVRFAEDRASLRNALDRGLTLREWLAEDDAQVNAAVEGGSVCLDCHDPLDPSEDNFCRECQAERTAS